MIAFSAALANSHVPAQVLFAAAVPKRILAIETKLFAGLMAMVSGKIFHFVLPPLLACGLLACAAAAQSQDSQGQLSQSVADAARQARATKKTAPGKPSKVISDDDLDTAPKPGAEGLNVGASPKLETEPPSRAVIAADIAADQAAANPEKKTDPPQVAKLKEQIAQVKKELNLDQRELALDQDTFYSNVDYSHDTAGKAKLAEEQRQITQKQQQLDTLKARLAALLEEEERKEKTAGDRAAPSETAPQPAAQAQPTQPQQ